MKYILAVSALCLAVVVAFGAVPSYTAFRGTGGITITSNPPTGNITIDGSSVVASAGTNATISTSTNTTKIAVASTNINFIESQNIAFLGTNIASRSDIQPILKSNLFMYTPLSGKYFIFGNNDGAAGGYGPGTNWGVWNGFTENLSFYNPNPASNNWFASGWLNASNIALTTVPGSGDILALDAAGSAFRTNVSTGGGSAGTNIGVGQTIYLDAAFGNDSTASRTNLLRPYLTASNATAALLSGDRLQVRGGTYPINPKTNFTEFPNINSSGGVTLTNKNDFIISGDPGSVWAMSSRISIGGTSSAPMMVIAGCTNFVIENMTFVGIRTTNVVSQDFAFMLDRCANWTFRNCVFSNWNNQGITDGGIANGLMNTVNQNCKILDCQFYNVGTTNLVSLGIDGSAISVNASNYVVDNCLFVNCVRQFEVYGNGDIRNWRYSNNRSFGCYYQELVLEATNNLSDGLVFNNQTYGYSTTLPYLVTEAMFCKTHGLSNVTFSANKVRGMSGVIWGEAGMGGPYNMLDARILDNEFVDVLYRSILIRQDASHAGRVERLTIRGNKIRNNLYEALSVTGNNTIIEDNELEDCGTVLPVQGAMAVGSFSAAFATNSTNILIRGNKIFSSNPGQYALATGIVVYAMCYSNVVFDNVVDRKTYQGRIHDLGVGTRTRPVNLVAAGSLLRSDAAGDERAVTIGSGITFDGTTLSSSGGGGTGTVAAGQSVVIVTNGSVGTVHVGSNDLRMSITNRITFSNGISLALSAESPTNQLLYLFNPNDTVPGLVFNNLPGGFGGPFLRAGSAGILELWNTYATNLSVFRARSIHLTNGASPGAILTSDDTTGIASWQTNLSVSTLNVNTLNVTNGIAAAGNSGAVQFNQGGVLAGTNDLIFNRTNQTLSLFDQGNEAGIRIHQNGIFQTESGKPFNIGLQSKTNMWSLSTANATLGSLAPWSSNMVSIGTPTLPLSNVLAQQVFYAMPTITVVGANSNQTVLAGTVNTVNMLLSTNATFTNHVVPPPGFSGTYLVRMKVTNSAANVGVNWGVGGTWDGVTIYTNANNTIWTTLTNTLTYLASWTYFGNNAHLRLSLEQ